MQVIFKYYEHYFGHFILFLFPFSSHMIREKGTKCLKCSVVTQFTLLIILQSLKRWDEIRILKVIFPLPSTYLPVSLSYWSAPGCLRLASYIYLKKNKIRCRTRPGCCYLVHDVTFDFSSSRICTHFPEHELCVSLTQSIAFSAPYLT